MWFMPSWKSLSSKHWGRGKYFLQREKQQTQAGSCRKPFSSDQLLCSFWSLFDLIWLLLLKYLGSGLKSKFTNNKFLFWTISSHLYSNESCELSFSPERLISLAKYIIFWRPLRHPKGNLEYLDNWCFQHKIKYSSAIYALFSIEMHVAFINFLWIML